MISTRPSEEVQDRIVEALHRIVCAIQSVGDLPALLQTIMEESKRLLDAETSSLFLYDAECDDLYFEVVLDHGHAIRSIRVPLDRSIVGAAATLRQTQVVNDCATDERHFKKVDSESGFVTRNLIAAPMIRKDRLIGVLEVLNKRGDEGFDALDVKILEIMAEHAAAQIENTRLIKAKVQAERLAALGTTAAGLAHYIKNILSQWKGSATLIDMGLAQGNDKMIANGWPILKRANDKIAKLVQDMLTISREREPELQSVQLDEMIREIAEECRERANQAGVELEVRIEGTMPAAKLDPARMHDMILNLLGNAVEAIEEHRIEHGKVTVGASFQPEQKRIVLEVQDNGPGMTPEVQARVFEPFFSTKGSKGTGLGLAVAAKTIEEHGGKFKLQSEVGKGSVFTIELPFIEPMETGR